MADFSKPLKELHEPYWQTGPEGVARRVHDHQIRMLAQNDPKNLKYVGAGDLAQHISSGGQSPEDMTYILLSNRLLEATVQAGKRFNLTLEMAELISFRQDMVVCSLVYGKRSSPRKYKAGFQDGGWVYRPYPPNMLGGRFKINDVKNLLDDIYSEFNIVINNGIRKAGEPNYSNGYMPHNIPAGEMPYDTTASIVDDCTATIYRQLNPNYKGIVEDSGYNFYDEIMLDIIRGATVH